MDDLKENSILKNMKKYGMTLALFAAMLTGLIVFVNEFTKPIIGKRIMMKQQNVFDQIVPPNFYNNKLLNSCFIVENSQLGKGKHRIYIARREGIPVGIIMEVTTPDGYSGSIKLLVGSDFSGTIFGVRVIEHHETPGLGDKIELRLSNWILGFSHKVIHETNDPSFFVKKDGGEFDQFTGATITPRAVVNAVKRAVIYAQTLPEQLSILSTCED